MMSALAQQQSRPNDNTMVLVVGMIITALLPTLTAFAAFIKAQSADHKGEKAAEAALATTNTVNEIHTAVNSERTAMLEKLADRDRIILELTKAKAVSDEKAHGMETAAAIQAAAPIKPAVNP